MISWWTIESLGILLMIYFCILCTEFSKTFPLIVLLYLKQSNILLRFARTCMWRSESVSPLVHCAVNEPFQLELKILLCGVLTGLATCRHRSAFWACTVTVKKERRTEIKQQDRVTTSCLNSPSSTTLVTSLKLLQRLSVSIEASSSLKGWTFPCCPPAKNSTREI